MLLRMKVTPKLEVEIEAAGQKEAFKALASVQEVLAFSHCGMCDSENLRFVVRSVDGNDYYEIRCADCGAILQFGQHKSGGTLFAKRKDKDGNWLEHNGWTKYRKQEDAAF